MSQSVAIVTGSRSGIGRTAAIRVSRGFSAVVLAAHGVAELGTGIPRVQHNTAHPKRTGERDEAIDRDPSPALRDCAENESSPALVEVTPSEAVRRQARRCAGMTVEVIEATHRVKTEYRFRASTHLLVFHVQGTRGEGETLVEGLPPSGLRNLKGRFTFVPSGYLYREWHVPGTLTHVVHIYLDPAFLPAFESGTANAAGIPRLLFEDAALAGTVLKLKALVESTDPQNRRYCEAVGAVLAHELLRLNRGDEAGGCSVRGGLAVWQQRLVLDYFEKHLAEEIPVAALARLVGLSRFHFIRTFKRSFGISPHRHHTRRRLEQAKAMLSKDEVSVTDIGLTLGFGSTSSFTTAFRKGVGITPTGFRRLVNSAAVDHHASDGGLEPMKGADREIERSRKGRA